MVNSIFICTPSHVLYIDVKRIWKSILGAKNRLQVYKAVQQVQRLRKRKSMIIISGPPCSHLKGKKPYSSETLRVNNQK